LERNQVPLSAEITCRFRPKSGAGLLRFLQQYLTDVLKVSDDHRLAWIQHLAWHRPAGD
jgi:hypothetical protein